MERLEDIFMPVRGELETAYRLIADPAASGRMDPAAWREVVEAFTGLRGKGLRPALVLLSANACDVHGTAPRETRIRLAAAVELIHGASLVHDDIIDGAMERRHRPAIHVLFGRPAAVLAGDLLFARAFSLLADPALREAPATLARCVEGMCRGEIDELRKPAVRPAEYEAMIDAKTASFMAACCETGASAGGAGREEAEAFSRFGRHFGMAYQLLDDRSDGDVRLDPPVDFVSEASRHVHLAVRSLERAPDSTYRRSLERLALSLNVSEEVCIPRFTPAGVPSWGRP
jgi:octaprenyl-diphosphate synthase